MTTPLREVATGLRFPEGPIAMPDGSFLVGDMEPKRIARVERDNGRARESRRRFAHDPLDEPPS